MAGKAGTYVMLSVAGLLVAGILGYAVVDSMHSGEEVEELGRETQRYEAALKTAREAARQEVRKRLQKERAAFEAVADEEMRRERTEVRRRRNRARGRIFGMFAAGRQFSEAYMKACEMPKEAPGELDQEIINLSDVAASEEDLDTAAEVAAAALESQDPRARFAAVEMLSGLGDAGLLDISEFLADPHPEVANFAAERWDLGIQNICDDVERTKLVKVGLLSITDEDQLRAMSGTLLLATDEALVVNTVIDVMRDGLPEQRTAVREAYEFVTGEKWTTEKAAAAWLAENYTPPPEEAMEPEESSDGE